MIEIKSQKILELISAGESETIEFKESFNDEAIETIGAFANARGGILFIGVKDSGEINGIQVGGKTLEDIANRIQFTTEPHLQPSISVIKHDNKSIIVISVSAITGVPISIRGRYFRRAGRTNQRMSHEEIMQRMIISTGLSWDAITERGSALSDLNHEHVMQFIKIITEKGRLSVPENASAQEILKKLELTRNEEPTRAALLLFGNNPESYFPSAFVKIGRFRSPTHIIDDREIHGTIVSQLDGIMGWFKERLETEFIIQENPQRDVRWEYPLKAIREAVINLVCHRDYTSSSHSQIRLYDDRLEFWNAGSLPLPLTTDSLFQEHDSIPRNRKIADAFFYTGLIERWGSGTIRIAEELKKTTLPLPKFESQAGRFRLIFYKRYLTEEHLKRIGLSERQLKVIDYIKAHTTISNTEYQMVTGVSKRTATRELNELKIKGVLVSEGKTGRGTVYRLKGS